MRGDASDSAGLVGPPGSAERCGAAIEVEELVMRLPGVSRAEAPALVEEVLRKVQDRLRGTGRVGRIHLAELRVRLPAGAHRDELTDRIAERIAEVVHGGGERHG